tara:strand:+ start:111 stop:677 length:567 start_codon:yes stop_codon:yes gene_type:complete
MIFKRNIMLLSITTIFIILNVVLTNLLISSKMDLILELENNHNVVNERYITAQILSQKLDEVYNIFENNLALSKKDKLNEEASMEFLKEITDLMAKNDIDLKQIIPGKKVKKGALVKIPYTLQLECDFEKLGRLVVALENNDRIIFIDDIYLKNNTEKMKLINSNDMSFLNQSIEMKIHALSINKAKL